MPALSRSRERRVVECERGPQQGRQAGDSLGAAGTELIELLQQRMRMLALTLAEQELGGGGERRRDEIR